MAIKNIAIIAHVDHGKTTLVDQLLTQSGTMKFNDDATLIMDSNDQERERGITIYAKNTALIYKDTTINIIDTPGHADFGSEVERVLKMVDSVLLLVDAYEGPMPQTKFVLKKSLEHGIKPIVVINKIDKPTARPDRVVDQVFDLFIQLGATDEQADFPIIYASARDGYAFLDLADQEKATAAKDITPLLDFVMKNVPNAPNNSDAPLRLQIVNLAYDNFVGRLGIGRITDGTVKQGQQVVVYNNEGEPRKGKVGKVYTTLGTARVETQE
jgi:GTP-binding protein